MQFVMVYLEKEPCSMCKSIENAEAHHYSYKEPYKIMWLCHRCHSRLHEITRALGGEWLTDREIDIRELHKRR